MNREAVLASFVVREPSEWRIFGREALAFARQATLLHRDLAAMHAERAAAGDDVVVLMHGLFATAGVLRPLRRHIEQVAGAHTASFSYAPGPGVESLAERLAALVAKLPEGVRIHLVGHSLGGLVARWFVQELGGDPRVAQTISLASPFAGTRRARLMPGPAGRDILPGSRVLCRLQESAHGAPSIAHLSIASTKDRLITESAILGFGEQHLVRACGHNALLYDPEVARVVARRVHALSLANSLVA